MRNIARKINKIYQDAGIEKQIENVKFPFFEIIDLCNELGIDVVKNKIDNDGFIEYKNGTFIIYVKAKQFAKRQIFTIAHELGHFINYKNDLMKYGKLDRDIDYENQESEKRRIEREANEFAAEILMPEDEFIEKAKTMTSNELSDYFGTSIEAIGYRALNLGIKLL